MIDLAVFGVWLRHRDRCATLTGDPHEPRRDQRDDDAVVRLPRHDRPRNRSGRSAKVIGGAPEVSGTFFSFPPLTKATH